MEVLKAASQTRCAPGKMSGKGSDVSSKSVGSFLTFSVSLTPDPAYRHDAPMAKTTITQITDDIDGSKNASEVSFSFEGKSWTIDLSDKNRKKLEAALKPYMDAGTRASSSRSGRRGGKSTGGRRSDLQDIRAWAKQNGHKVSERGRISSSVVEAYDAR
jgi:hypothetical protein